MDAEEREAESREAGGAAFQADGYNAGYADRLYEGALRERGIVPPSLAADWAGDGAVAAAATLPAAPERPARLAEPDAAALAAAARAADLVRAVREQGYLAVPLDPLGAPPPGHPSLDPAFHDLDEARLRALPAAALGLERLGDAVATALAAVREVYCGRIGYELEHVDDPERRDWLVEYIESGRHWAPFEAESARALLERLTEVEGLERFLHRAYLGKKRFSIEGLDMMVPMLDEVLARAAAHGTRAAYLGMAHRGRLNVLAHVVGRPYEQIVAEFEGAMDRGVQASVPPGGAGDVKYHIGARGVFRRGDTELPIHLAPNPSHLEHVNPVVEGMARAARDLEEGDRDSVLPILIHGDAAFMGQGVVAETLNLSRLEAYETGGTIHLIANNQLGFTTSPEEGRSTRYASDLALGFRIPVLHVGADDPEACLAAVRLAADFRHAFGQDLVIDLVGYRRYGHNEGDEPGYTQPAMYAKIEEHPSVRTLWARRLAEEGVVSEEDASAMEERVADRLAEARERLREETAESGPGGGPGQGGTGWAGTSLTEPGEEEAPDTAVHEERLRALNGALHALPDGFEPYAKLGRQLARRAEALDDGLDWAHGEALAFASIVTDGIRVRLTGEDTERGTFSQRHLVLHEADGTGTHIPLRHLSEDQAPFEIHNSPLSEVAALGFEYGYSAVAREALVLWEAQFGDFVNVGQAIIDQFVASGRSKWGQESRLTLLLPHGYEGQGPEHSSARLERFLQLAAEENLRVANCTTPAQYFHLLRLQALRPSRRPLIVMTPKSLLRHPRARSALADLSGGRFRPVLQDEGAAAERAQAVTRVVLCSGKVYYDLLGADAAEGAGETAVVRLERLYPFPSEALDEALAAFPNVREVRWVQEEPANMGAWRFLLPRLRGRLPESVALRYVGRPEMASPADGYAAAHESRQERIVTEAFAPA